MCNENKNFHYERSQVNQHFNILIFTNPCKINLKVVCAMKAKNFHYERSQVNQHFNIYKPMQD